MEEKSDFWDMIYLTFTILNEGLPDVNNYHAKKLVLSNEAEVWGC
jgi:hypothetical protein